MRAIIQNLEILIYVYLKMYIFEVIHFIFETSKTVEKEWMRANKSTMQKKI